MTPRTEVDTSVRKRNLATVVTEGVSRGGRIEMLNDQQAILVYRVMDWSKLLVFIMLCALFFLLPLILLLFWQPHKDKRQLIIVDKYGDVEVKNI